MARSAWDHWYRRALPAYWLFLLCATHFPKLTLAELRVRWADKLSHTVAFGLLAFLLWRFVETWHRPLSARFVWLAAALIGLFAAADEWTQPWFGRSCDVFDWLMDMFGSALVLALLEWRRRRGAPHSPVNPVDSKAPER